MADETPNLREQAKAAIYEGIVEAAAELKKHNGNTQAAGMRELAEAYAWVTYPNQPH